VGDHIHLIYHSIELCSYKDCVFLIITVQALRAIFNPLQSRHVSLQDEAILFLTHEQVMI